MVATLARKSKRPTAPASNGHSKKQGINGKPTPGMQEVFREGLRRRVAELLREKFPLNVQDVADIARDLDAVQVAGQAWNTARIKDPGPANLELVCDLSAVDVSNPTGRLAVMSYLELLPALRKAVAEGTDAGKVPDDEPVSGSKKISKKSPDAGERPDLDPAKHKLDPDEGRRWQESPDGAVQQLIVADLVRHPDNREPSEQDIVAMMASLSDPKVGQLEPIVVWPCSRGTISGIREGVTVILSGETRWKAAKRLGWETIQGRVASGLSPAQALQHLARYNGERRDLDPMQKARLINRLCQSVADGGAGLTRQAAGERVGLKSGSAASNLVRLLELPKKWQDRVAAGELDYTWAREMMPYVPVFKAIDEELERDWKNRETDRWDNAFESRKALIEQLERIADEACPRLDRTEIWIGNKHRKLTIDIKDPATIAKLGIVELELATGKKGQTEKVPVATNAEAFDELVAEFKAKGAKASASKAGEDDKPAKRELSPAEKKQKAADRTKQLGARISAWRQALIRRELICKLDDAADDGFRLVMAYIAGRTYNGPTAGELLEKGSGLKSASRDYEQVYWPCVAAYASAGNPRDGLTMRMAKELLAEEPVDWRRPIVPAALVEGYAEDLRVDVAAAWRDLQFAGDGNKLAGEDLLEEFFLLHQTDELRDLAKELGKHVSETANKAAIIKLLLGVPRGSNQRLPLPKSIKPVAGVKTAKAKKGAK